MRMVMWSLLAAMVTCSVSADTALQRERAETDFREQAQALVGNLRLHEKVSLLFMEAGPVERLGIPAHDWWSEALHGVARNGRATQFPQSICMASTWNPRLIRDMAHAIGQEARAKHHAEPGRTGRYQGLTIWSPTINVARDPRWGRNEETYGEDPLLTSEIGVAFVRGLQGDHPRWLQAVATVKHFVANNSEYNRNSAAPPISMRALREYYLPAYRAAVQKGHVASIMTAYNGINGVPCSGNIWLLDAVLRGEWGFTGTVVTDVTAGSSIVHKQRYLDNFKAAAALMLEAGVDVFSERNKTKLMPEVIAAVESGAIPEAELDEAVTQNLATRLQLGQMDSDAAAIYRKIPQDVVGCDAHRDIARQIAREGIVLLKNDPVGAEPLLPISRSRFKRILVMGPYARQAQLGGYSGSPTHSPSTPIDGLSRGAGGLSVAYREGLHVAEWKAVPTRVLRPAAGVEGHAGLKAEYFAGTEYRGTPETVRLDTGIDFSWPKPIGHIDPDIPQPVFAVRWTGMLVPEVSGVYQFAVRGDDGMRVWLNDALILDDWGRHSVRRKASSDITLEAGRRYALQVAYFDAGGAAEAHLEWREPRSAALQPTADERDDTLVVYVGGFNRHLADEGQDLMDLALPAEQREELQQVVQTYPNTVVVLNGGTIVVAPWLFKHVPAVLQAWYPGQEGGDALADLLFGKVSPSGRTPLTWHKFMDDIPDFDNYEVSIGRTYQYCDKAVQFPFGHGLGYTHFDYRGLELNQTVFEVGDAVTVKVRVRNTGQMDADEVLQLYARNVESPVYQPLKKLIAFQRVAVPAGAEREVTLHVPLERLAHWDADAGRWLVEPGAFDIMVGASAGDIRLAERIQVR